MCSTFELCFDDGPEAEALALLLTERYGREAVEGLGADFFPKMRAPVLGPAGRPALMGWGFPPASGKRVVFNARGESVWERPMFRPYAGNRCLIPATSFYEWDARGQKRRLRFEGAGLFYMAALWRPVALPDGGRRFVFVILTTAPNRTAGAIHSRMPAVIPHGERARWLTGGEAAFGLLRPLERPMSVEDA